jgi:hypothetical protein
LVEQPTLNRLVAGSIPARSTICGIQATLKEYDTKSWMLIMDP